MPEEPMAGLSFPPRQAPPLRQMSQLSMEIDGKLANPKTAHDSGPGLVQLGAVFIWAPLSFEYPTLRVAPYLFIFYT